jgi:peptide/nickel transport system permease protein
MGVYIAKRIAWAAVLFLVLTFVTYVIFFVIPHGRGTVIGRTVGLQDLRSQIHGQGNIFQQYWDFLSGIILHGSLGTSIATGHSVTSILRRAAPVTITLVLGGAVLWMLIAVPVGLISALRPGSIFDRTGMVFVLLGISVHPVWLGLMLGYWFGYRLAWFPHSGYCDAFFPATRCGGPGPWAYHMILPWLTFSMVFGAFYARLIRASVMEGLHEDWVRTARAKGAPEWMVIRSHVLRTALLPIVAALAMDIGALALGTLGVSLFVETAFGLPGLGKTATTAFQRNDLPVIVGVVVLVTVSVIIVNLIADLIYAILDPRLKARGAPA